MRVAGGRDRLEHRAADRDSRRLSGLSTGNDSESVLFIGLAGGRAGGATDHRRGGLDLHRGWRRIDLVRAKRAEQTHDARAVADAAEAGDLLDDAADRGEGRRALSHLA